MAYCSLSQAQSYTVTDGNSLMQIDLGSSAGVSSWEVGGVDYMDQQWFYYRIGSTGPEYPIQNISSTPTVDDSVANELGVTYANSVFSVDINYKLTDSTGKSQLILDFGVVNLSGAPLDLHFFAYTDLDLGATPGESSRFTKSGSRYTRYAQWQGPVGLTNSWTSGFTPMTRVQAGVDGVTLGSLLNGGPTDLNNQLLAGPGNTTYAMQWDYVLGVNGVVAASQTLGLTVPEPSTLALMVLGSLGMAGLRRGRR